MMASTEIPGGWKATRGKNVAFANRLTIAPVAHTEAIPSCWDTFSELKSKVSEGNDDAHRAAFDTCSSPSLQLTSQAEVFVELVSQN